MLRSALLVSALTRTAHAVAPECPNCTDSRCQAEVGTDHDGTSPWRLRVRGQSMSSSDCIRAYGSWTNCGVVATADQACCDACLYDAECDFWVRQPSLRFCWLFTGINASRRRAVADRVSGVPPPPAAACVPSAHERCAAAWGAAQQALASEAGVCAAVDALRGCACEEAQCAAYAAQNERLLCAVQGGASALNCTAGCPAGGWCAAPSAPVEPPQPPPAPVQPPWSSPVGLGAHGDDGSPYLWPAVFGSAGLMLCLAALGGYVLYGGCTRSRPPQQEPERKDDAGSPAMSTRDSPRVAAGYEAFKDDGPREVLTTPQQPEPRQLPMIPIADTGSTDTGDEGSANQSRVGTGDRAGSDAGVLRIGSCLRQTSSMQRGGDGGLRRPRSRASSRSASPPMVTFGDHGAPARAAPPLAELRARTPSPEPPPRGPSGRPSFHTGSVRRTISDRHALDGRHPAGAGRAARGRSATDLRAPPLSRHSSAQAATLRRQVSGSLGASAGRGAESARPRHGSAALRRGPSATAQQLRTVVEGGSL
eukprot:TRINITY_DN10755_c0_g1_i1.p1 TRINITY_DN10755_c0_g1~~TRINITY_DN10755_c0_g1_i1.p1  ORF type:complete len:562 (+),score=112.44 TRINITY_DN10755_c0_g1_i1:79-1686(+)